MSEPSVTRELRMLIKKIRAWREDKNQGYGDAIHVLCETEAVLEDLVDAEGGCVRSQGTVSRPPDVPEVRSPEQAFRDGYAMGYADRHDGQSPQPDYQWTRCQCIRALEDA
jgi:hypothetical protein